MAVKSNFSQLKAYQKSIEELGTTAKSQLFYEKCIKELAARFLAKVIRRTPVGDYSGDEYTTKTGKKRHRSYKTVNFKTKDGKEVLFRAKRNGKVGGTLRRAWTAKTASEAESGSTPSAATYANMIEIKKIGHHYHVTITNPMQYASYVEKGHRKRNHKGWVNGKFMMKISDRELNFEAPNILRKKFNAYLKEALNVK